MGSSRRGVRAGALSAVTVCVLSAIILASGAQASSVGPRALPVTSTYGRIHMMGWQEYGNQPSTAADYQLIARADDMVVAQPIAMRAIGPTLKADNPSITLLVYENGMYAGNNDPTSMPESWYLHTAGGERIISLNGGGTLMNPRSTAPYTSGSTTYNGWADYLAHQCLLHQTGVTSGCYLDMLGPSGIRTSYNVGAAVPVDSQTGAVFTPVAYETMTGSMADATRAVLPPGSTVIGNGYLNGHAYYLNGSSTLNGYTDAAQAQAWISKEANLMTLPAWQRDVQMVIDNGLAGSSMLVHAGCPCTSANVEANRTFDLATYLLANTGHAFFDFNGTLHTGTHPWEAWSPMYDLNLGTPAETFGTVGGYFAGGVYQRGYSGGRVLVNPDVSSVTVSLPQTYHTLAGDAVTSVVVAAHSAVILTS